jgi:hypothetical protein
VTAIDISGLDERVKDSKITVMCRYRDVIRETFGIDCDGIPGTGAIRMFRFVRTGMEMSE